MFRRTSLKCDRFMRPMAFVSLLTVLCVLLCACGTAVPTGSLSSGGDTPPVTDATTVRETTPSTTDATTASVTEKTTTGETPTTPPTTSPTTKAPTTATTAATSSAEPSVPLVMAERPDEYGKPRDDGNANIVERDDIVRVYISDYLAEMMATHKDDKVLYRVLVETFVLRKDEDTYCPSTENAQELQWLYDVADRAQKACDEAKQLYLSTPAGELRNQRHADYEQKQDEAADSWKSYHALRDADKKAYTDSLLASRMAELKEKCVSLTEVSPTSGYVTNNVSNGINRIAVLAKEDILSLANTGAYSFSLAPPPRREGYSSIIADELTDRLHTMKNTDKAKVLVVYRDKTHGAKAMTKADILALANSDKAEIIYDHNYAGSWTIGIK